MSRGRFARGCMQPLGLGMSDFARRSPRICREFMRNTLKTSIGEPGHGKLSLLAPCQQEPWTSWDRLNVKELHLNNWKAGQASGYLLVDHVRTAANGTLPNIYLAQINMTSDKRVSDGLRGIWLAFQTASLRDTRPELSAFHSLQIYIEPNKGIPQWIPHTTGWAFLGCKDHSAKSSSLVVALVESPT